MKCADIISDCGRKFADINDMSINIDIKIIA